MKENGDDGRSRDNEIGMTFLRSNQKTRRIMNSPSLLITTISLNEMFSLGGMIWALCISHARLCHHAFLGSIWAWRLQHGLPRHQGSR